MAERQTYIDRIKGAERECYVIAAAIDHFGQAVQIGNAQLPALTSPRDLAASAEEVESTYLIRMWAEFENAPCVRIDTITGDPDDQIKAIHLINWTAGVKRGRSIAETVRDDVHEVREYRNFLVHERDDIDPPEPVTIKDARTRLNTFLHCLPMKW